MTNTDRHLMTTARNLELRRMKGFTLIELMIVVAVVAILAAIALPSYQDSVRKGRRGQAKSDLIELAQRAERFRTVNNSSYVGFWATVPTSPINHQVSPRQGATAYYRITEAEAAGTYTLTATPQNGQERDVLCGTLSIDQTGTKSATADPTNANRCW